MSELQPTVKVRALKGDNKAVFERLVDGLEHSVSDIQMSVNLSSRLGIRSATAATVTARIRDLRKPIYGGFKIEHRQAGKQHFYRMVTA